MTGIHELLQLEYVKEQIIGTFNLLIKHLETKRDALLEEVDKIISENGKLMKSPRCIEDVVMENHQLVVSGEGENTSTRNQTDKIINYLKSRLPKPKVVFFSCPTLYELQNEIAQFGEIKDWKVDYSVKDKPDMAAAKLGKCNNELIARGLAIDEKAKLIYVADWLNLCIQKMDFDGKCLKNFGQGELNGPWGIEVTQSYIYVSDNSDNESGAIVQFGKEDLSCVNKIIARGKGERLKNPRGLCTDYNGDVYLAESNSISTFTKDLQFINCFGNTELNSPQDVKITSSNIVVLDKSLLCIHFYSKQREWLHNCMPNGSNWSVNTPRFFCLDNIGNIIISNTNRHDVKIFSPRGYLIGKIGKKGHQKGDFYYPYGIHISETGTIFVISCNSNFCLQSF